MPRTIVGIDVGGTFTDIAILQGGQLAVHKLPSTPDNPSRGITAGIGGLAYAGIPATHRGAGHAIAFVTAHMAGGALPDDGDWGALAAMAAAGMTLAIYMPLGHIEAIAARLMAAGLDGATPAAAISRAATRHQRVLETRLDQAAEAVAAASLAAPAILAIGRIVTLRRRLDWLGAMAAP